LIVLLVIPAAYVMAGPGGPGGDPGAPIDGGISLLVAAGIGYGAKKARDARKKTKQPPTEQNTGEV
ncbi:MAG TPA: hypothetical protein VG738_14935, partial [Chitinophagaceae bacterium]|nr:hypothetical protein [Chitinophagaceae bacterium]HWB26776.1 hypothetical protein [Chitinophagaceae bacterium]